MASAQAAMMIKSNSSSDLPNIEEVERFIRETKEQYGDMVARGDK